MTKHFYQIYGITFATSIHCPELQPGNPDDVSLTVTYGTTGEIMSQEKHPLLLDCNGLQDIRIAMSGISKYRILDGREIIVEAEESANEEHVRHFIYGTCMGIVLHQRSFLPLHGTGIVHEEKAVLFLGRSGIGKSTLGATFFQRGYQLISDDVCPVKTSENGEAYVYPGFPQIKLTMDSVRSLDINADNYQRINDEREKILFPIHSQLITRPLPLKKIFIIQNGLGSEIKEIPLTANDCFKYLKKNTYRYLFLKKSKQQTNHLDLCRKVIQNAQVSIILKPDAPYMPMQEIVDYLEQSL